MNDEGTVPLACNLAALPDDERAAHLALGRGLLAGNAARELGDGYAWSFGAARYDALAEFIGRERLCCPFSASRWSLRRAAGRSSCASPARRARRKFCAPS